MSDNLAELLYQTLVANTPNVGMVPPPFNRLSRRDRETWEAIATKARKEIRRQCFDDLDAAYAEFGGGAIGIIEERWFGNKENPDS